MIGIPAEKSNIAWFKLAEFVMRKEKERALGIYRLLEHSFNNQAFAQQLEADLLAAFNDEKALEKYYAAAQSYENQYQLVAAFFIYEKIFSLSSQLPTLHKIITLAQKINFLHKTLYYTKCFINLACQQGMIQQAHDLITFLSIENSIKAELHELCIKTALDMHCNDLLLLSHYVNYVSQEYVKHNKQEQIITLLDFIQEKSPMLYKTCQNNYFLSVK